MRARMRFGALGVLTLAAADGCVVVYNYGDYQPAGGPCETVADCPGVDTECGVRVCVQSQCYVKASAPEGTVLHAQVPDDCQRLVCRGGLSVGEADDADTPDDRNPCTDDACSGGVPLFTNTMQGVSCGQGASTRCDGSGSCAGCITELDCPQVPPEDAACLSSSCDAGLCVTVQQPEHTPCGEAAYCDPETNTAHPQRACDAFGKCSGEPYSCEPSVCGPVVCAYNCSEGGSECAPDYTCVDNICERCLHCLQWLQDPELEGDRPWCPGSEALASEFDDCACGTCGEACGSSDFCSGGGEPVSADCELCIQNSCPGPLMGCYLDADVAPQ